MSPPDVIRAYRDGFEPCARHPSRRARGWCDTCGRPWCRDCIFPAHSCPSAVTSGGVPATPAGVFLVLITLIGLAAIWALLPAGGSREPSGAPPGRSTARAPLSSARNPPPTSLPDEGAGAAEPWPAAAPETPATDPLARPEPLPASPARAPVSSASLDRGPVTRPDMLLSFDAGARAEGAAEILDVLAAQGIRTTFFVTGEFVRSHPDLARRLVREGHEVGNHTDGHPHLTLWEESRRHDTRPDMTRERLLAELRTTEAAFREATGRAMAPLWRAPYGEVNTEILEWAAAAGWRHVGWTRRLDTLDWVADAESSLYREPDEIARRLLAFPDRDEHRARGGIVLMHLGSERPGDQRIHHALPGIVEGLRRRGLRFTTASAMLRDS